MQYYVGQLSLDKNSKFRWTEPIKQVFSFPQEEEISIETNLKEIANSLSQDETRLQKLDNILQEKKQMLNWFRRLLTEEAFFIWTH